MSKRRNNEIIETEINEEIIADDNNEIESKIQENIKEDIDTDFVKIRFTVPISYSWTDYAAQSITKIHKDELRIFSKSWYVLI